MRSAVLNSAEQGQSAYKICAYKIFASFASAFREVAKDQ